MISTYLGVGSKNQTVDAVWAVDRVGHMTASESLPVIPG